MQDTEVSQLVINKLTREQFESIQNPSDTELYLITDESEVGGGGTSRNIGELVHSTLPLIDAGLHLLDGSKIDGTGIYSDFVTYIKKIHKIYDNYYNVTIFGETQEENNVLSNFATTNYAKLPMDFTETSKAWELCLKIKTGTQVSGGDYNQVIFGREYSSNCFSVNITINKTTGNLALYLGTGTNTWDIASPATGTLVVQPETDYYLKLTWNGSVYKLAYSTDGETYTDDITVNSTDAVAAYTPYLGTFVNAAHDYSFLGSIDLNECYINSNGKRYWSGVHPSWCTDEKQWQDEYNTYRTCGKFVYDPEQNTVRLPRIVGIVEGTTDMRALGNLVQAGLPNITGRIIPRVLTGAGETNYYNLPVESSGAFKSVTNATRPYYTSAGTSTATHDCSADLDASLSSPVYGRSSTVQPQTIKVFIYMVIATSKKLEVEVDIDNIVAELTQIETDIEEVRPAIAAAAKLQTTQTQETISTGTIVLNTQKSIYKITPAAATTFSFNTSGLDLTSTDVFTFELLVDMSTLYSLTFPNTVTWQDSEAPDLGETGTYILVFRTLDGGSTWIGNLQGVW